LQRWQAVNHGLGIQRPAIRRLAHPRVSSGFFVQPPPGLGRLALLELMGAGGQAWLTASFQAVASPDTVFDVEGFARIQAPAWCQVAHMHPDGFDVVVGSLAPDLLRISGWWPV